MIDEESFTREFAALSAFFERRRRKYLGFFYAAIALSALLAASAIWFPEPAMRLISRIFFITRPLTPADITAYRIFIICLCALLVIRPVHFYRSIRFTPLLHAGQSTDFSLKDAAYSRMFALFGEYEFTPHGSIPLASLHGSLLCGEHPHYRAQGCVSGQSNGVGVKLCSTRISHPAAAAALPSFQGIAIVCDISGTQVKLRVPFKGKMVLAESRLCDALAHRPTKKLVLSQTLTAYCTDMTEAQRIASDPFTEILRECALKAAAAKPMRAHLDDRIAAFAARLRAAIRDRVESLLGKTELAAEKAYSDKYAAKARPDSAPQKEFSVEYFGDKCIALIPCARGLVESKSLFAPVMTAESARLIYAVMHCADRVSEHLNEVMP